MSKSTKTDQENQAGHPPRLTKREEILPILPDAYYLRTDLIPSRIPCSQKTFLRACQSGMVKFIKRSPGSPLLFKGSDIIAWMDAGMPSGRSFDKKTGDPELRAKAA